MVLAETRSLINAVDQLRLPIGSERGLHRVSTPRPGQAHGKIQLIHLRISGLQYTRTAVPGYQSSKAAVLHLTNVMMTRLLPHHVRVNALAP